MSGPISILEIIGRAHKLLLFYGRSIAALAGKFKGENFHVSRTLHRLRQAAASHTVGSRKTGVPRDPPARKICTPSASFCPIRTSTTSAHTRDAPARSITSTNFKPVLELRDYLRKALAVTDEIEGFSCRPGQEKLDVKHSVTISPSGVALPEFFLQDGQRLVFRSRKTMLAQRRRASRPRPETQTNASGGAPAVIARQARL